MSLAAGSSAKTSANTPTEARSENASSSEWGESIFGPPIAENDYTLIQDEEILKLWMQEAEKEGFLAIDTETTSLTPRKAELVGISIATHMGEAAYIPIGHKRFQTDLLSVPEDQGDMRQLSMNTVMRVMKPVLENENQLVIHLQGSRLTNNAFAFYSFTQVGTVIASLHEQSLFLQRLI